MIHGAHVAHAARERRRILRAFRSANALGPERARTLAELGLSENAFIRGYRDRRVIREIGLDRYYLDEDAWREFQWMILRWIAVPVAVLLGLLVYALARR